MPKSATIKTGARLTLSLPQMGAEGPDEPEPPILGAVGTATAVARRTAPAPAPDGDEFVIGERAAAFRDRVFPDATDAEWNDWKWQLRHRLRDIDHLTRAFSLSEEEHRTVVELGDRLPVGITPYYASLLDPDDPMDGLRRTMIPVGDEFVLDRGEVADPLDEDGDMPVPGLVHRYPDRVLFLVTSFCATYCRYCTRSRLVGKTGEYHFNTKQFERALAYIEATPTIRDVLISGGDPLTMNDDRIDWLLGRLRAIRHVEFVRIGSKIPCVLPQRITPALCASLRKHHPLWMSVHFMHPREITPEVAQACGRLADAGVPLGSQTVLTRNVNDTPEVMKQLMHNLLKIRVRPYYIYQCDPIPGSRHFRTPVETGIRIIEALRGHTTGYAVPSFVIDGPGGGGKIPLSPEYVLGREGDDIIVRNYAGEIFRYPDPLPEPVDAVMA
ncbi:MAG: KamA family radical SAM protein [Phycisphaerales bacterium]|nr:KamA family radical SAM protein [Phycisphaerales bacterium]